MRFAPTTGRRLGRLLEAQDPRAAHALFIDALNLAERPDRRFRDDALNLDHLTWALLAVGRRPNTDGLALDSASIETDTRGYITVDDQCRTSAEGVWAVGDCNGRGAFTHTSWNDHEIVVANLSATTRAASPTVSQVTRSSSTPRSAASA